jgi:flagellar L-ring protein precursor FlgH
MKLTGFRRKLWTASALPALCVASFAAASQAAKHPTKQSPPDMALSAYSQRVRAESAAETHTLGSIWVDSGKLVRLSTDNKAIHLHDVVSIVVLENLAASTDGTVKNSRSSSANSQVSNLFGKLSVKNNLQNLLNASAASALNAQGQSVSNSSLATALGGEVVDLLPNGMMVVQAVRQVAFNQQTQVIRLRGLVRPEDVDSQNRVLSSAMTDLELEVVGKGIINDSTYRQNPLVRMLERILVF